MFFDQFLVPALNQWLKQAYYDFEPDQALPPGDDMQLVSLVHGIGHQKIIALVRAT